MRDRVDVFAFSPIQAASLPGMPATSSSKSLIRIYRAAANRDVRSFTNELGSLPALSRAAQICSAVARAVSQSPHTS
jgi:hypothetical protein